MLSRILSILMLCIFSQSLDLAAQSVEFTSVDKVANAPQLVSVAKKNIPVVRINQNANTKHRFYIQAGLHGNERLTTGFAFWLIGRMKQGKSKLNQIADASFDILPAVNPDGFKADTRLNKNLVNLNRNFSFLWGFARENPGSKSFSEPETRAIRAMFDKNHYTAAVDVHGYTNWVVAPTAPSKTASSAQKQSYELLTSTIKSNFSKLATNYEFKTAGSLGDGGAFEDWAFWEEGVPAFCLEMASALQFDMQYQKNGSIAKVDTFEHYETYLYQVFTSLVEAKLPTLVAQNPQVTPKNQTN